MNWNQLSGYIGLRAATQARIGEFWPDPDFEHIEGPTGASWTPVDELQDQQTVMATDGLLETVVADWTALLDERLDAWFAAKREARVREARDSFFTRLQASRDLKTEVIRLLRQARSLMEVYKVSDLVAKFDATTPAWMQDAEQCAAFGLRPLSFLYDHVAREFARAEARVRH